MTSPCCFCDELSGSPTPDFAQIYSGLRDRLIRESENFAVLPTLGQLVTGHLLLIPKNHIHSFGQVPMSMHDEAHELYDWCVETISHEFTTPVCFEHGSAATGTTGGCGVIHAHMHFVPTNDRAIRRPLPDDREWREVDDESWFDVAEELSRSSGYAYWHSSDEGRFIRPVVSPPSQYLRQHVARELGVSQWDWRRAGREPAFEATLDALRASAA